LISDPHVKAVLINIFGGILRCDRLAEGVIKAVKALGVTLPIVIRMEGTNVELGRQMLRESGLNFVAAQGMRDAAAKAVQAARAA
jgi:succinyl-CoA synthetase beta subunit